MHLIPAILSSGGLFPRKAFHYYFFFTLVVSQKFMHRFPPKLSLSCLKILYPVKCNCLLTNGREISILVSDTKNLSNALSIKGFSNFNLFLRDFNLHVGGLLLPFLSFQIEMAKEK